MKNLRDKVAVITGAGSGIGRALALALAGEGARLALSDINAAALAETVGLLPAGTEARTYTLDVSCQEAVFAHADEVQRDFGTAHLLFNNAGTTLVGLFENQSMEEIRWLVNINLWGVMYGSKAFLPMMLAQREGCIVNMSSVLGLVGFPTHSAYNITKFAVRGLTESLWSELAGTGVEAICVHPGGIDTGFETRARVADSADHREHHILGNMTKIMQTTPAACAADIIAGVRRGRRRIVTGRNSKLMFWLPRLFPQAYPRFIKSLAH
ncbi:MAG: SDR family oxidoreductase [Halieaceae bacterium]|nr:SDR family oxidoreductase [Halieaceae bacterium]